MPDAALLQPNCEAKDLELLLFEEEDYENWDPDRLLETDAVFLLRDVCRILSLDSSEVAGLGENSQGLILMWNNWFVRMRDFSAWYRHHFAAAAAVA